MPEPSSAGLKELLNRRFVALLVVSFLASFVSSPLYSSLLPVYVEAGLARSPLFSAGLRGLFFMLGGPLFGSRRHAVRCLRYQTGTHSGPVRTAAGRRDLSHRRPLSPLGPLYRPGHDVRFQQYGRTELSSGRGSCPGPGHGCGRILPEQHARQRRGKPAGRTYLPTTWDIRASRTSGLRDRRGNRRSVPRPVAEHSSSREQREIGHAFPGWFYRPLPPAGGTPAAGHPGTCPPATGAR